MPKLFIVARPFKGSDARHDALQLQRGDVADILADDFPLTAEQAAPFRVLECDDTRRNLGVFLSPQKSDGEHEYLLRPRAFFVDLGALGDRVSVTAAEMHGPLKRSHTMVLDPDVLEPVA